MVALGETIPQGGCHGRRQVKAWSARRNTVDGGEDYEVGYLMKKHHLERADALRLVKKYGNNRAKIEEELATRKV